MKKSTRLFVVAAIIAVSGTLVFAQVIRQGPVLVPGNGRVPIQPLPPQPAEGGLQQPAIKPLTAEQVQANLAAALKSGAMVFTATVESVNVSPVATMIYPPRTTMAVGFKDSQMLKGEKIDGLKFLYTATQGRDFTPGAGKNVLVISGPITNPPTSQPAAVQPGGPNIRPGGGVLVQPIGPGGLRAPPVGPGMARPNFVIAGRLEPTNATIQMMVEATDANVATARKATGVATSRPDSAKTQADSKS